MHSQCSPCLRGDKSAENQFTTEPRRHGDTIVSELPYLRLRLVLRAAFFFSFFIDPATDFLVVALAAGVALFDAGFGDAGVGAAIGSAGFGGIVSLV